MKNGLPYLSRELFWLAMKDIARKATLLSGHTLDELQEMLDTMTYEPQPQVYSVKTVAVRTNQCGLYHGASYSTFQAE